MRAPNKGKSARETQVTVSFSDTVNLVRTQIEWTPKGVSLLTKWPFAEGAELEFAFDHDGERHCCVGVVVACHPLPRPAGFYETVLYFIETPCTKVHQAACDCRLAPDSYSPDCAGHSSARHGAVRDGLKA
jgi:hypothetical protein